MIWGSTTAFRDSVSAALLTWADLSTVWSTKALPVHGHQSDRFHDQVGLWGEVEGVLSRCQPQSCRCFLGMYRDAGS